MKLWADIPIEARVSEAMLSKRAMADRPGWLEKQLQLQSEPKCQAAVQYAPWLGEGTAGIWQPCGLSPSPGEQFCATHGGPKIGQLERRITALERRLERLTRKARQKYDEAVMITNEAESVRAELSALVG